MAKSNNEQSLLIAAIIPICHKRIICRMRLVDISAYCVFLELLDSLETVRRHYSFSYLMPSL